MLPSTLKYIYYAEPVRMHFPAKQPRTNDTVCNAAMQHCTQYHLHSDWFNGIEILLGRWHHGEKVGYCYPSGLEKSLCKWDIYVPLVTKGLNSNCLHMSEERCIKLLVMCFISPSLKTLGYFLQPVHGLLMIFNQTCTAAPHSTLLTHISLKCP
jgi:hypothetical protein